MDKKSYYLRSKVNQNLYVYLEIGKTWEDSFAMEFCKSEVSPRLIMTGVEHKNMLVTFHSIANTDIVEVKRNKEMEWLPIKSDQHLEYIAKTLKNSVNDVIIEHKI